MLSSASRRTSAGASPHGENVHHPRTPVRLPLPPPGPAARVFRQLQYLTVPLASLKRKQQAICPAGPLATDAPAAPAPFASPRPPSGASAAVQASLRTGLAVARQEIRRLRAEIEEPGKAELITRVATLEATTSQPAAERAAGHQAASPASPTSPTSLSSQNHQPPATFQDQLQITHAMSLLQADVDTSVIALWLGHAGVRSTDAYIHADMSIKERALALTTPASAKPGRYRPTDNMLAFLESL